MTNFSLYEKKKKSSLEIFGGCMLAIFVIILTVILYAVIGMWLWNLILVPLFGAPVIGYWQMYGIMILARMIFGRGSSSSSSN
jgi:hypothetical protein